MTSKLLTLGAAAALTIAVAVPAGAQDEPKPAPSCMGVTLTDPPGDESTTLAGVPFPVIAAGPNTDIQKIFFTEDGENVFVNIQVAELNDEVPLGASAVSWYVTYTVKNAARFVEAELSGGEFTYNQGNQETTLSTEGPTKGKAFKGKDGVISIVIPAAQGGVDGAKLQSVAAFSATSVNLVAVSLLPHADDTGEKGQDILSCGGGALPVKIGSKLGSAKKASKAKKATLLVTATEAVSEAGATLSQGGTVVGSVSGASLKKGKNKLKLSLTGPVKAGSYDVEVTGTGAGGAGKATGKAKFSK